MRRTFSDLGGALLVGNFNDEFGQINAFSLTDGSFPGSMLDTQGNSITIPYLWEIAPRNGYLFFVAGIGDEGHRLLGRLASVPESATWAMMIAGFALVGVSMRPRQTVTARFAF